MTQPRKRTTYDEQVDALKRMDAQACDRCDRCGRRRSAHILANYSDGPRVGIETLICPTATWKEPE